MDLAGILRVVREVELAILFTSEKLSQSCDVNAFRSFIRR